MATGRKLVAMVVVIMVGMGVISEAAEICGVDDEGLSACKPWVTKPCPTDPPPATCCDCLSKADFQCLCNYKDSLLMRSLGIDSDLALALPAKCSLTATPPC